MRRLIGTALVAVALAFAVPSAARASWLSEYLHQRFDPVPTYPYYNPAYSDYYAPDYTVPYYYGYEWPSYGYTYGVRPWYYGHAWHDGHDWHDHHYAWHHGHEWHGRDWHGRGHEGHHH
jgi:hypothetical protein